MAIEYSPQGRRVELGGPGSRGFAPVEAADSSQGILRRGQTVLENFAKTQDYKLANPNKDLEGLASLSKTVTEFMVENQKTDNDKQRKLGIADILNGDLQPRPESLQIYRDNAQTLKTAAQGEQQALNTLQQAQPAQALEIRANNPVINAWRAYGQAQGIGIRAGNEAESLLVKAMDSNEATIPLMNEDGSFRYIAPSAAKTPAELNAAWSVVLQGFIGSMGIDGLNPLLLSEHVAPKIQEVKAKIFDKAYTKIAKKQAADAVEKVTFLLGEAVDRTDLNNSKEVQGLFQDGVRELELANPQLTRAEANEFVYDRLLAGATDPNEIDNIGSTIISADGSSTAGTLNNRFPGKAQDAKNKIIAQNRADAETKKAEQLATVENAVKAYERTVISSTPEEAAKLHDDLAKMLVDMESKGLAGASEALVLHMQKRRMRAGQVYLDAMVAKQLAEPGYYKKEQILQGIADGVLPPGFDSKMAFPTDLVEPQIDSTKQLVNNAVNGYFLSQMSDASWKPSDYQLGVVVTRKAHMVRALTTALRKGFAQDPKLDPSRFIEDQMKILSAKPWYQFNSVRSKNPGFPVEFKVPLEPNTVSVNVGTKGASTRLDYSKLPVIDFKGLPVRPKDRIFTTDALKQAGQDFEKTGSYPSNITEGVKATGLTYTEFTKIQTDNPRGLADRAQTQQEAILDNPRSTPWERFKANYELERRKQLQQAGQVPIGAPFPEAAELLRDLGKGEGGPKGYEAGNKGKADDLPGGIPGLTGMTIDQVLGMKEIHHAGKYQFQLGPGRTLESLKTRMGLRGSEKMTPELQDRMALELIYGGWKQPDLTEYLKGGGNLEKAAVAFNNEWEVGKLGFNVRPYLQKMRAAYVNRGAGAVGRTGNFRKENVASVRWESPGQSDSYQKGGVDIYFNDKQFPAIAPGKVIDIARQPGSKNSYGIYVITEHKDPKTGLIFQLINAHMDATYVKIGDTVNVGTILGKQGSTGSTSAGGIASIDPLEPAPRGSKTTIPYRRPEVLKELLSNLLR